MQDTRCGETLPLINPGILQPQLTGQNKYWVTSQYFYLIIVVHLHTVKLFEVTNSNNNR